MDATRKTVIVTDSSCDLSDEQLSRYGIRMISLRIVCQNAEYRDRIDIQEDELYELLTRELPKTSLPLPEDVTSLYESLAQEGVTDVIHMSISSGLSGTFNMVRMITQDFEGRMRVHMVDSRTLSMGLGMMVLAAARALEEGATPEEAIERAQTVRRNQLGMFVIRTLEFLRKGGRIGKVEGVVGSLLQIKPIIYVNDEGIYATLAKARGYRSAVDTMVSEVRRMPPVAVTFTAPPPALADTSVEATFCCTAMSCSCILRACAIIWLRFMPPMLYPLAIAVPFVRFLIVVLVVDGLVGKAHLGGVVIHRELLRRILVGGRRRALHAHRQRLPERLRQHGGDARELGGELRGAPSGTDAGVLPSRSALVATLLAHFVSRAGADPSVPAGALGRGRGAHRIQVGC